VGRKNDERGATVVEFALLLPVIVLLIFGIIDFGTLYNNYQSVRQGARDGMRQAVVKTAVTPTLANCNGSTNTDIQMATRPAAGSAASNIICYTKQRVGLKPTDTRVSVLWQGPSAQQTTTCVQSGLAACPFPQGNAVMVCVQYPESSTTGLLSPFLKGTLNTQAETLIEVDQNDASLTAAINGSNFGVIQETPLTSWPSSCSTSKL